MCSMLCLFTQIDETYEMNEIKIGESGNNRTQDSLVIEKDSVCCKNYLSRIRKRTLMQHFSEEPHCWKTWKWEKGKYQFLKSNNFVLRKDISSSDLRFRNNREVMRIMPADTIRCDLASIDHGIPKGNIMWVLQMERSTQSLWKSWYI